MAIPDVRAKEMFETLFNMDFLTEDEKQTVYDAAELYAVGRVRFETQQKDEKIKELECRIMDCEKAMGDIQ